MINNSRIGFPCTVLVRSVVLRGFDQEMASLVKENMSRSGVNFIMRATPSKIEKRGEGRIS